MAFKYFKQEKGDTCGAACMRMALYACGIEKTEKEVEQLLDGNTLSATWHDDFVGAAEKYKLSYIVSRNSTIIDLKKLLKQGYIIILCYTIPEAGIEHYSVLQKIDTKNIFFWDPYNGPGFKRSLTYFQKNWHDDGEKAWFFAVKRK